MKTTNKKPIDLRAAQHITMELLPILIGCYRLPGSKRSVITLSQLSRTFSVPEGELLDLIIKNLGAATPLDAAMLDGTDELVLPLAKLAPILLVLNAEGNPVAKRVAATNLAIAIAAAREEGMEREI